MDTTLPLVLLPIAGAMLVMITLYLGVADVVDSFRSAAK